MRLPALFPLVLLGLAALACAAPAPNVLFILGDDLRPAALVCHGSKHVR